MKTMMMTVTLLSILREIDPPLTPELLDQLLTYYAQTENTIINVEMKKVLEQFLEALVTVLNQNPGLQYFQESEVDLSDRIWSTTLCGIATKKNVLDWLRNSIKLTNGSCDSQIFKLLRRRRPSGPRIRASPHTPRLYMELASMLMRPLQLVQTIQ